MKPNIKTSDSANHSNNMANNNTAYVRQDNNEQQEMQYENANRIQLRKILGKKLNMIVKDMKIAAKAFDLDLDDVFNYNYNSEANNEQVLQKYMCIGKLLHRTRVAIKCKEVFSDSDGE